MKSIYLFIISVMLLSACRTSKPIVENGGGGAMPNAAVDYLTQSTWLLGYFSRNMLTEEPHGTWFNKGYDEYNPDAGVISKLQAIDKEGLSIKIVMGTWCPDSRREVPRFMKVLDHWRFPAENVRFIGVDIDKNSPVGEYEALDIERVPTFIIYKNNIEAGRIIENPVASLEQDLLMILETKNN